ncbi:MAG TPA: carbon monoxide dehydrogenase subunit G [Gammaproteobacteria bacterium]|jgi:carbon monoxide dehydrogenase subunit G
MKMAGSREIEADPDFVWARLNDPEVLRQSIAGCESMRVESEGEFVASLKLKLGPVSAAFDGRISLSDIVANRSYTITFEGLGGVTGFGRGVADVSLEPKEYGTLLVYAVEAEVGGKVARIGRPLVRRVAHRMINEFFTRFEEAVLAART